jgi:hypothetical protein
MSTVSEASFISSPASIIPSVEGGLSVSLPISFARGVEVSSTTPYTTPYYFMKHASDSSFSIP